MRNLTHIEIKFKVQKLPTEHSYYGNFKLCYNDNIEYFPKSLEWYRGENKKFPMVVLDNHDMKVTVRKGKLLEPKDFKIDLNNLPPVEDLDI